MCKKKVELPKPEKQSQSSTNVGLLNLSENTTSAIPIAEILSIMILLVLFFFLFKWCCKRHRRVSERRQQALEQMIQRVEARPTASAPQAPVRVPAVTFENPGERVVFMKSPDPVPAFQPPQNNSVWDRYK